MLVTFAGASIAPTMLLYDVVLERSLGQRWTSGLLTGGALAVMIDVNTVVTSMVFTMRNCVVSRSALVSSSTCCTLLPCVSPRACLWLLVWLGGAFVLSVVSTSPLCHGQCTASVSQFRLVL